MKKKLLILGFILLTASIFATIDFNFEYNFKEDSQIISMWLNENDVINYCVIEDSTFYVKSLIDGNVSIVANSEEIQNIEYAQYIKYNDEGYLAILENNNPIKLYTIDNLELAMQFDLPSYWSDYDYLDAYDFLFQTVELFDNEYLYYSFKDIQGNVAIWDMTHSFLLGIENNSGVSEPLPYGKIIKQGDNSLTCESVVEHITNIFTLEKSKTIVFQEIGFESDFLNNFSEELYTISGTSSTNSSGTSTTCTNYPNDFFSLSDKNFDDSIMFYKKIEDNNNDLREVVKLDNNYEPEYYFTLNEDVLKSFRLKINNHDAIALLNSNQDMVYYIDAEDFSFITSDNIDIQYQYDFVNSVGEHLFIDSINKNVYSLPINVVSNNNDVNIVKTKEMYSFPNPFNPVTTISFELSTDVQNARLNIYNLKGQSVYSKQLTSEEIKSGKIVWDANKQVSGIYFAKLISDKGENTSCKLILMK